MKECRKCKEIYEESAFYKNSSRKDGLSVYCKICAKSYTQEAHRKNPEISRRSSKKYTKKYPEKHTALQAKRRGTKAKAIPSWMSKEELFLIEEAYNLARLREKSTKILWHVDHIVPLKGKNVCGLHTIKNLQVIPAISNILKSNIWSNTNEQFV